MFLFVEALENLPAGQCDMSCVAMVCLYVQDMSMFAAVNSVYRTYFGINPPARCGRFFHKEVFIS